MVFGGVSGDGGFHTSRKYGTSVQEYNCSIPLKKGDENI